MSKLQILKPQLLSLIEIRKQSLFKCMSKLELIDYYSQGDHFIYIRLENHLKKKTIYPSKLVTQKNLSHLFVITGCMFFWLDYKLLDRKNHILLGFVSLVHGKSLRKTSSMRPEKNTNSTHWKKVSYLVGNW